MTKSVKKDAAKPANVAVQKPEAAKDTIKKVVPAKAKVAVVAKPEAGNTKVPAPPKPAEPKDKVKKPKLVRDSFTMPEAEYQVLADMKKACLKAGVEVKKSELLRVGVALIRQMDVAKIKEVLNTLPPLKAGRPKKDK
jgi:LAS superfamily LD-carboxypeptidase LdcB